MATDTPTLRDILTFTKDGEWGKGEPAEEHVPMKVIRGTDFDKAYGGDLSSVPIRYIAERHAARKALQPGDILIETAGGSKDRPTGRTMLVKERLLRQSSIAVTCASFARFLRFDVSRVEPGYAYWFLQHLYKSGQMEHHQVQHTGVARFQFTRFSETVPFILPPLAEQRRIAAILGALDRKIELNRTMSRTLEEMAQAIFKSWFVDFDGHDDLVDSGLGPIPRGWEAGVGDDLLVLLSGGTPKTSVDAYWNGTIPWFSVKDAPDDGDVWVIDTEKKVTKAGVENSATQLLPPRTTIISARGTVGKLALTGVPMAMNQSCYGVRGSGEYPEFFTYYFLRFLVADLQRRTHGSVFDTITRQTFQTVPAIRPPVARAREFHDTVAPLLAKILANIRESRTLGELRDALLPKLISGEVRVPEAEETIGGA